MQINIHYKGCDEYHSWPKTAENEIDFDGPLLQNVLGFRNKKLLLFLIEKLLLSQALISLVTLTCLTDLINIFMNYQCGVSCCNQRVSGFVKLETGQYMSVPCNEN